MPYNSPLDTLDTSDPFVLSGLCQASIKPERDNAFMSLERYYLHKSSGDMGGTTATGHSTELDTGRQSPGDSDTVKDYRVVFEKLPPIKDPDGLLHKVVHSSRAMDSAPLLRFLGPVRR